MPKFIGVMPTNKTLGDMKDGDVAVVLSWGDIDRMVGKIIQRVENEIIVIGEGCGAKYSNILTKKSHEGFEIKILGPGDRIEF